MSSIYLILMKIISDYIFKGKLPILSVFSKGYVNMGLEDPLKKIIILLAILVVSAPAMAQNAPDIGV